MQCPSCGHSNDPGNRFCEYCGARLDPAMAQDPTVPGPPPFQSESSYDAPTMFVPAENDRTTQPAPSAAPGVCPECGYANQPDSKFCDQCGSALQVAAAAQQPPHVGTTDEVTVKTQPDSSETPTPSGGTPMPDYAAMAAEAAEAAATVVPVETPIEESESPDPVAEAPSAEPSAAEAPTLETPATPVAPAVDEPVAETPDGASATGDPHEERTRLEAAIQEQRDNLAMFEQMAARYQGREAPAHIQAGLSESQAALAEAEAQLAAFDAAQSAAALPDPAELERLNNAIQEHQDNLAMFEQMSTRYQGRDIPAHIQAGLAESRQALADAQSELAALQGGQAPPAAESMQTPPPVEAAPPPVEAAPPPVEAAPPPVEAAPPPPVEAALPPVETAPPPVETAPPPVEAAPPPVEAAPPPVEAAPPVQAPPSPQPRLIIDASGASVYLPVEKDTVVIGREDPISGIFPEVDMTPHGGEAGGVSRQHARLHRQGSTWYIEDLNSTNYTRVNGNKLEPNTPTPLNDGDTVMVGRVAVRFHSI